MQVTAPRVPRAASFPLPLRVPGQSLPGDIISRLPKGVAYPSPPSFLNLSTSWLLVGLLPQVLITDLFWPVYPQYVSQTSVCESLDLAYDGVCCSPRLSSIEDCFYIAVENFPSEQ